MVFGHGGRFCPEKKLLKNLVGNGKVPTFALAFREQRQRRSREAPGTEVPREAPKKFQQKNRGKVWRLRKFAVTLHRFPLKRRGRKDIEIIAIDEVVRENGGRPSGADRRSLRSIT